MSQMPSVGRIVHYNDPEGFTCHAAVVTAVIEGQPGHVALRVFPSGAPDQALDDVAYNGNLMCPGTWHWPERTEPDPWRAPLAGNIEVRDL